MHDLLIRGATVIDGSGGDPRSLDVAVRDGRISAVESRRTETAVQEIDASGRVLAPGFIDIHTHSDFTLPLNPLAEAKIRQGVTTEVVGNCGFSVAPTLPGKAELLAHYLSASAPWLPFIETDFAGYMAAWPAIAVNTVMQVGHNTLRLMAMGMENRPPNESELRHIQQMLAEALDAGVLLDVSDRADHGHARAVDRVRQRPRPLDFLDDRLDLLLGRGLLHHDHHRFILSMRQILGARHWPCQGSDS